MSKRKIPQYEIVARELRFAGSRGVHTFELRKAMIANPSERIRELEKQGYVISKEREKLHGEARGARYKIVSAPPGSEGDSSTYGQPIEADPPAHVEGQLDIGAIIDLAA